MNLDDGKLEYERQRCSCYVHNGRKQITEKTRLHKIKNGIVTTNAWTFFFIFLTCMTHFVEVRLEKIKKKQYFVSTWYENDERSYIFARRRLVRSYQLNSTMNRTTRAYLTVLAARLPPNQTA
jgi:hypothetical protein